MTAGLTDLEALNWLDGVRRSGLERRFSTCMHPGDVFDIENPAALPASLI